MNGEGNGEFNNPLGLSIDKFQNIYVVDNLNNRVQKFDKNGHYILQWGSYGKKAGQFIGPHVLAIDNDIIYVTENINNLRIQVFDLLGNYIGQVAPINKPTFKFHTCKGIAVNKNGELYVSDNDTSQVTKIVKYK